ncbi:clavesin-2-like [Sinocyclocheilus rhinocerous]|uniref:clavesin-2-like n=1 Tax=Sinocyclocheilus rhinocerous TaxID=307959 RepID=UPI0007BA7216|nr:PREDICTED: clavesin-2-like [Sinocyclocheilus rhinocerous]
MTHLQAGLSPETLEKAKVELKENPDTLHQDIQEVRDMIITRPDIGFLRTDLYTFVDILRAILLSLEAMIEDPELQVNGFVLIIDWSNFTFKQASKLTPSMLRLAIEGLQPILPSELGGMLPPYDMGTWARTLLDHAYDEETDYCPESYTLSVKDLEKDLSPKTMKRSQSVVEPGVLKRPEKVKSEEENMQPLLSLD